PPAATAPAAPPPAPADPPAPAVGSERVLPPPTAKIPPHPATRAQLYQPQPAETGDAEGHSEPADDAAATEEHPAHHAAAEPPPGERSSIEQWMSDLRSARRRPKPDEDAKHRGGEGRQVSVNELLRRQDRD
ncbi:MMPL family transporter, partial [Nocardia sp. NPDC004722]